MEKLKSLSHKKRISRGNFISGALPGMAYIDNGEYEKATEEFNALIKLNPNYYLSYEGLGKAYFELGDYEKAE